MGEVEMKTQKKTYLIALAPFLLLCILFEIIPVIYTVVRSFFPEGGDIGFTLENYINIFTGKLYQQAIINSLLISVLSSAIGLAVAFIGAKAVHEEKGKLKTVFMSILNMVSNFSGVPLAFAYIIMFGNIGVMTMIGANYGIGFLAEFPLYSVWGLLLIYVYFNPERVERGSCASWRKFYDFLEKGGNPGSDAEYPWNIFCIVCQCSCSVCICLCAPDEQCFSSSDPSVGTVCRRYHSETGVRKRYRGSHDGIYGSGHRSPEPDDA